MPHKRVKFDLFYSNEQLNNIGLAKKDNWKTLKKFDTN